METQAYLHLALSYEVSAANALKPVSEAQQVFSKLTWQKRPNRAFIHLVSLSGLLIALSVASHALTLGTLQRGDSGPAVTNLQNLLQAAGCYDGPITGSYGTLTEEAVRRCQQLRGLTVDGIAGPATLEALQISEATTPTRFQGSSLTVEQLQVQLRDAGFYTGAVDGVDGPQTDAALREFQRANGLVADGVVGPETEAALRRPIASQPFVAPAPITASPFVGSTALRRGASGPAVTTLQNQLRNAGYFPYTIDGIFGQTTEDAVRQFQLTSGLIADGVVGLDTQARLSQISQVPALPSTAISPIPIVPVPALPDLGVAPVSSGVTPAPTSWGVETNFIRRGDRGPAVTTLQAQLRDARFYAGPIDGIFGLTTEDAVRRFQAARGLITDGIVGPETQLALGRGTPTASCVYPVYSNYPLYNTVQQGDRIVLGRPANYRYVVVVPVRDANTLNLVRRCVPDAFRADSRLGPYVHAGAFPSRAGAETLSRDLRTQGLDARVAYF